MRSNSQKGFTLLELLMVILILGVLGMISIPQYQSYRDKGERSSILSDCRALYGSFILFYLDYEVYPNASAPGALPYQAVLDKTTFAPLTLTIDDYARNRLLSKMQGGAAHAYDSPDLTLGTNQAFYLVFNLAADPTVQYVVASSDFVHPDGAAEPAPAGECYESGGWLDGVFTYKNMTLAQ